MGLESGNLLLGQTKFRVFWQNFQIPVFFLTGMCFAIFPVFPVQCPEEANTSKLSYAARRNAWLSVPEADSINSRVWTSVGV